MDLIANSENLSPEELQSAITEFFQQMQADNLILDPSTMKLVSRDGLTDEQIRKYGAATDEKTLQSYLNIQNTDITDGSEIGNTGDVL